MYKQTNVRTDRTDIVVIMFYSSLTSAAILQKITPASFEPTSPACRPIR